MREVWRPAMRRLAASAVAALPLLWAGETPAIAADACGAPCNEEHCVVRDLQNTALGNAKLARDASCRLVVGNIGGSGQDGVIQTDLGTRYMKTTLATPNLSLSMTGTRAVIRQLGVVDGVPDQEVMVTDVVNYNDTHLRHSVSCSAMGVQRYRLWIYRGAELVHVQEHGPTPPLLVYPKADMVWMACGIWPNGDVYTVFELGSPQPIELLSHPGAGGPFTGDLVFLAAFSPSKVPTLQNGIENLFTNTGPVTLASIEAGELPGVGPPCLGEDPARIGQFARLGWQALRGCATRGTPVCPAPCPAVPTLEESGLSPACYQQLSSYQDALAAAAFGAAWGGDRCPVAAANACAAARGVVVSRLFWRHRNGQAFESVNDVTLCTRWLSQLGVPGCGSELCAAAQGWVQAILSPGRGAPPSPVGHSRQVP